MRKLLLLVTGTFDHAVCFKFSGLRSGVFRKQMVVYQSAVTILCSLRGIVAI
ncbi:unnamed protein product [Acanthoscelides obtectus]|uniref:Uncharacterized protein n=1 Tax=Acanthoscelides obtectus TaxID=200917 RepID=A0A9P0K8N0_ACAOB|nr:unnamed protein product [Acanthoscelides obtectus]CAK1677903.1 hypothetical protein AOBTE_LOCUS31634 [Acanthoscelides obtectus]